MSSAPSPAASRTTGSVRSTSTLHHLIKQVDKELATLARRHTVLESQVEQAAGDHAELARIGTEMAEVAAAVADAEERWLALSEEAEAARSAR